MIISALLWLLGCSQVDESDTEEGYSTGDSSYEYSTENLGYNSPSKEINCPVQFKIVELNGNKIKLEIPTQCSIESIDKGRPVEKNNLLIQEEIIFENNQNLYDLNQDLNSEYQEFDE